MPNPTHPVANTVTGAPTTNLETEIMTQYYVAHDDVSVYAIGPTPADAIREARADTQAPDAQFQTAQITAALAAWIQDNGWDGTRESFTVVNGALFRTTGLDERLCDLRSEAERAGDVAQVALCDRALSGDPFALAECVCVLDDADAQRDT
jgi:hypothetical protein